MKDEETLVQRAGRRNLKRRGRAFLTVLSGRDVGRVYKLGPGESVIGRGQEVDVVIVDTGVSRRHAKVVRDLDGTSKIVDMSSTNGTFVNGRRVDAESLREGDRIRIGQSATLDFRYEYTGDSGAFEELPSSEDSGPALELARGLGGLGRVYPARAGHYEAALRTYERTLKVREESFGTNHPAVAAILDTLAGLHRAHGDFSAAETRHERAIAIYESRMGDGPEPPELAHLLNNFGETYLSMDNQVEALKCFERALSMLEGRKAAGTELAPVRFSIARALTAAQREPLRAKTLAQLAHDGFVEATNGELRATEVSDWLKKLR